ncbi:MAG TPA: biopolymer transporter ExbD [Burkholderiales bacterium]|nr:biopolymer transporter ExbD [Burkholderiales bacterium]
MDYFNYPKKARIEIIPMIDIMLFLLVFFIMITLHMIPLSGLVSSLATSTTASSLPEPKLTVLINGEGKISVNNKTVSAANLTSLLRQRDPVHTQVTIAGAKNISLQQLMGVMDACRSAGVTQIGLAAREIQ